jgi:hypothetical protein
VTQVRAIWEWVDNAGGFLRASSWVFSTVGLFALETALQADSNAVLQFTTAAIPDVSSSTPGTGQYNLVTDLALLIFQTGAGTTVRVVIPGPLVTTFGPTSNVVNPLDPATASVIAAVIGTLGDASGNVVTAYVSGIKASRRTEQE